MSNDTQVAHEKFDIGDQCWWQVVHRNTMCGFNFLDSTWTTIAADVIEFDSTRSQRVFIRIDLMLRIVPLSGNEQQSQSSKRQLTMIRDQRVKWIGGLAIAFCATVVMAQSLGDRAIEPLSGEKADCPGCRVTGEACFLGIDPEFIGCSSGSVCPER